MKNLILLLAFILFLFTGIAISATTNSNYYTPGNLHDNSITQPYNTFEVSPFKLATQNRNSVSELDNIDTEYDIFSVDLSILEEITRSNPESMTMKIPGNTRDRDLELELEKVDIFSTDFRLTLASGQVVNDINMGTHYRGIIKDDENSFVAISVYENEIMGLLSNDDGNLVLGKLKGSDWNGEHILYNDKKMLMDIGFECDMPDDGIGYTREELEFNVLSRDIGDCIRFYIEVDYDLFYYNGGLEGVTNYVTGLLNQVITLYNNENIATIVSEIMIWDVESPYTGVSSSNMLSEFQQNTDAINGDLGQLLSAQGGGGKAASFAGICNSNVDNSLCFSDVNVVVNPVPIYSWSVMVVTHEFGHLFGSRHTHACVWNGDNTAIDGCSGSTEGNCSLPGNPPEGGTIMSYCHLTDEGIDFVHGFGPQPGNVIRNNVVNATCTTPCGTPTCDDNVQNGEETGIDCGGPDCAPCPCESGTDDFLENPFTHSGSGSNSITLNYGSPLHQEVAFSITDINQKLTGSPSRKYIEVVTVTFNDGNTTQTYGTYFGDQQSSVYVYLPDTVAWVTVSLEDGYADGNTSSTMSITFSQVSSCGDYDGCPDSDGDGVCDADDICPGYDDNIDSDGDGIPDGCDTGCPDSDGDGVCDADDICPGYDDNIDSDGDGIPDGCDNDCTLENNEFPTNPLTHSGTGSSFTTYDYGTPGHTDVSFVVSELGSKINGNPGNRYIDLVTVTYSDAAGNHTYGTFSGDSFNSVDVDIAGPVFSVTVTLEDAYDGNPPGTLSVNMSSISSCLPSTNLTNTEDPEMYRLDCNISELSLYPNPANEIFTIRYQLNRDSEIMIRINNINGSAVFDEFVLRKADKQEDHIDVSQLPPGIYFLHIRSEDQVISRKLIISR